MGGRGRGVTCLNLVSRFGHREGHGTSRLRGSGQFAEDARFQGSVRFLHPACLARGVAHLPDLPGELRAQFAHEEMKPEFQASSPSEELHCIRSQNPGNVFARDHELRQPFNSRQFRSRILALCISTP